jgi:serine/threonine-protein kinase
VLRKIAHGGMAEIFTALQVGAEGFEKPVVLKRILPALSSDPAFVRMLVDEAHIASSLNHSHLVQVLDLGKAGDQFFLVLEFVDGWSLEQVRRRARKARVKLPLPLSLYVVSALCRALDYVHRRTRNGKPLGIVHRDVTPQNVLLSREGEVKLADFGIAKAIGRREKSATGVIKGKFAYMSPEQSIGAELDARSDLFSVGTLLYLLTTGQKPFDAPTDLDVLMQVRKARYEKPSTLVRDFNPDVERFIARALRADRARRWQSAEQMADRLDNILVKLGQSSGPAALKRWLETLSARDGIVPPGDMKEVLPELPLPTGTMQIASGELELQDVAPPEEEEPHDDDEEEEQQPSAPQTPRTRAQAVAAREQNFEQALSAAANVAPSVLARGSAREQNLVATAGAGTAVTRGAGGDAQDASIDIDLEDEELEPETALIGGREPARAQAPSSGEEDEQSNEEEALEHDTERTLFQPPPGAEEVDHALEAAATHAPARHPEATSALLLTRPVSRRRSSAGRLTRWARRAALATLVVPLLLGGGAYFARPFLPAWMVPNELVQMVDGLLKRLPGTPGPAHDEAIIAPASQNEASRR